MISPGYFLSKKQYSFSLQEESHQIIPKTQPGSLSSMLDNDAVETCWRKQSSCEGIQLSLYSLELVIEIKQLLVTEFHKNFLQTL